MRSEVVGLAEARAARPRGLAGGGLALLGKQAVAVVTTLAFSFTLSFLLLKLVDKVVGLRVSEEEEVTGLDLSQHEEAGYAFGEGGGSLSPAPSGQHERQPATAAVRLPEGGSA